MPDVLVIMPSNIGRKVMLTWQLSSRVLLSIVVHNTLILFLIIFHQPLPSSKNYTNQTGKHFSVELTYHINFCHYMLLFSSDPTSYVEKESYRSYKGIAIKLYWIALAIIQCYVKNRRDAMEIGTLLTFLITTNYDV